MVARASKQMCHGGGSGGSGGFGGVSGGGGLKDGSGGSFSPREARRVDGRCEGFWDITLEEPTISAETGGRDKRDRKNIGKTPEMTGSKPEESRYKLGKARRSPS